MTSLKPTICLLPRNLGLGGPASFLSGLESRLRERGYGVSHDVFDRANAVVLVIGGTRRIQDLLKVQCSGVRIVQRLNGMNWVHRRKFTGVRHFIRAELGNMLLSSLRRKADRVVYQSRFTHDWWERVHGKVKVPQRVIHNGVDTDLFSPGKGDHPVEQCRVLIVEGHHGGGYEGGLLSAVELVRNLNTRLNKPVVLSVAGDVPQTLVARAERSGQVIEWLGVVSRKEIVQLYRSSHLFFSADINAACPNAVLEAMACGLPVVSYDTGALPELVTGDSGRVAKYGGDVWRLEPPDTSALVDAALTVLEQREKYSVAARSLALERYNLDLMVDRYLDFLLGE